VNGSRPLLAVLVHGIGPQNSTAQYEFLDRLRAATIHRLQDLGRSDLAPRLLVKRADWSHLFNERGGWLAHLFPSHASQWTRARRILTMVLYALVVPVIGAVGTGFGMLRLPPLVFGWVIGTAVGLVAASLAAWFLILPRYPWGHLWTFARGFEANTLSDVVLYGSDAPREEILKVVLDTIEPYLAEAYPIDKASTLTALPVVFVGHSLGTVVVYDILLGTSATTWNKPTAVHRDLAAVNIALAALETAPAVPTTVLAAAAASKRGGVEDAHAALQERKKFLERAKRVQDIVCPVGMATMGSPISLFLFRKPSLLDSTDLWTEACPAAFAQAGALETSAGMLRWRWQNFWHSADFVAHHLEPLFNRGYPAAPAPGQAPMKFVEDVKAREPISAHSTYWTNPALLSASRRS